jgi:hypothetical protein
MIVTTDKKHLIVTMTPREAYAVWLTVYFSDYTGKSVTTRNKRIQLQFYSAVREFALKHHKTP